MLAARILRAVIILAMNASPNTARAVWALWAPQSKQRFSTVAGPPIEKRVAVFEGQEPPLLTAPTTRIDERALASVPLPDLSRSNERDVARVRPRFQASTNLAGTHPPFQLALDELVEGFFEEQCRALV